MPNVHEYYNRNLRETHTFSLRYHYAAERASVCFQESRHHRPVDNFRNEWKGARDNCPYLLPEPRKCFMNESLVCWFGGVEIARPDIARLDNAAPD